MRRIFTNGGDDYVRLIFDSKSTIASSALLAAPYFTDADRILALVDRGASVRLLVGLNEATNPHALRKLRGFPGLAVRFLTSRFHAKIYIFDDAVLLGSANLTDGGLVSNREAVICLDREEDAEAIEEVKALFMDLWDSAAVLTDQKLEAFTASWKPLYGRADAAELAIEKAVGKIQPRNVHVDSRKHNPELMFLEQLRIMVYEQLRWSRLFGQFGGEVKLIPDVVMPPFWSSSYGGHAPHMTKRRSADRPPPGFSRPGLSAVAGCCNR